MSRQFAVLGNPGNRRVRMFVGAAIAQGLPHPIVLSWLDYLAGRLDLEASLPPGTLLRLDSPGEHPMVDLLLLERAGIHLRMGDIAWGEIGYEKAWFRGWSGLMTELADRLAPLGLAGIINSPASIRLMYDKWATHDQLAAAGISQPARLGKVEDFEHLLSLMDAAGTNRVFLKPFYSSSASGVMAFRRKKDEWAGTTSVEMQGAGADLKLFNSLQVRTYRDPAALRAIIDRLAKEDLLAEEWIPKMSFQEATVDLRILVIKGRARQVVLRSSQSPLTNLHLGNARGDVEAFAREMGEDRWSMILRLAEDAVQAIPGAGYAGVDLLVPTGGKGACIIEVNAFGDLLPKVLHEGEDSYTAFVNAYRA